ncbi:hypothetical protein C8A05DRAFT_39610, partial [Staphylotrichum tortipilum]
MDHFNATIKDGKLVKTRRGLQVSRQKFNGLSFVNTSPQEPPSGPSGPSPSGVAAGGAPSPAHPEIIFVDEGSELHGGDAKDGGGPDQHPDGSDPPKRRRRPPRRGKSPATPSPATPSPSRRSPTNTATPAFHPPDLLSVPHPQSTTPSSADPPLSAQEWSLFERHLAHAAPRGTYPYEALLTYNPLRGAEFRAMVAADMAAVHCVLAGGCVAEAVERGASPRELACYIGRVCAVLNRKLGRRESGVEGGAVWCIAELARVGCAVGRLDHWLLHMRGLKKVLDINGGLVGLPQWLLASMHKADIQGASTLAIPPFLPFTRHHGSIAASLPTNLRSRTRSTLSALLTPLGINPEVTAALSSLALLASAVRLARAPENAGGGVRFDPDAFTEEWQAVGDGLLTRPRP